MPLSTWNSSNFDKYEVIISSVFLLVRNIATIWQFTPMIDIFQSKYIMRCDKSTLNNEEKYNLTEGGIAGNFIRNSTPTLHIYYITINPVRFELNSCFRYFIEILLWHRLHSPVINKVVLFFHSSSFRMFIQVYWVYVYIFIEET